MLRELFKFPIIYLSCISIIKMSKLKRVLIIGGGHNGLVAAAYLSKSKANLDVTVLERRHIIGGAAVTEELFPGFKFSRASYLAGLMRPQIISELGLQNHGFKYLSRNPSSFTPTLSNSVHRGKSLIFSSDPHKTWRSIAQFSKKDADAFVKYEEMLSGVRELLQPILDAAPPDLKYNSMRSFRRKIGTIWKIVQTTYLNRKSIIPLYELLVGSAEQILNRWFESDILKATLATDAVIGSLSSPKQPGSAYVLLHHVMGETEQKGVWAYMEGGMGTISNAIAEVATLHGTKIHTQCTVRHIMHEKSKVCGVILHDGTKIDADIVISGCNPYHTFIDLLSRQENNKDTSLPEEFVERIKNADYNCGAMKINLAVDKLPNFKCCPSPSDGTAGPSHRGTVHFETTLSELHQAYLEASTGVPANRPVIEMTIPTSVDTTIAPKGKHIVQLFVQFIPYEIDPKIGSWHDPAFKHMIAERCFDIIEKYCPGFTASILYKDILSPLDLEQIFRLHKGNIFHGSLTLNQLAFFRPASGYSNYRTPMKNLYLCGSGAHPGGGVMGAPGRNCSMAVLDDL